MDSFEWNKIAGAVLFAVLVAFGLSIFSEILFEAELPEEPGYVIAVVEETAEGEAEAAAQPIGILMASADPAAGEASIRKCSACHSFGEGEPAKVGPNLWNVVMRPIASTDYEYSEAMIAYAAQAEVWNYEHLNAFLLAPAEEVPGTKMAFAGLKNDAERANVIAYLRTLSANPAPLPEPEAAPAEEAPPAEAAPAGEGAAPAEAAPAGAQPAAGAAAPAPAAAAEQPAGQAAPAAGAAPAPALPSAAPADAGGAPAAAPAAEAAGEGGTGGQSPAQPDGSLGPIDSVPADQQGGVPVLPPAEQPEPEPPAGQGALPAVPAQQDGGAQTPAAQTAPAAPASGQPGATQPAPQPAVPAAPAAPAPQPAETAPAAPAAPAPAAPIPLPHPPPAPGSQSAAPPAPGGQQVAQSQAPAAAPATAAPAAAAPASPFVALVAAADPAKGEAIARRCRSCHVFEKGGHSAVGPLLWDVVNRPVASIPDYPYSEAMIAFSAGGAKHWTYDELSAYLLDPKAHVPGNKMAFPGLKKDEDRANVIAFLRTLSDNPAPF